MGKNKDKNQVRRKRRRKREAKATESKRQQEAARLEQAHTVARVMRVYVESQNEIMATRRSAFSHPGSCDRCHGQA